MQKEGERINPQRKRDKTMKELIYNNLTNGNEILGIILAMLYFIIPMVIIGAIAYFVVHGIDAIGTRRMMKEFRKHPDLYEYAKERYYR